MSESTGSGPVMDGSDDATNEEKLAGLAEQVKHDHGGDADGRAAADELEERTAEADVDPEGTAR